MRNSFSNNRTSLMSMDICVVVDGKGLLSRHGFYITQSKRMQCTHVPWPTSHLIEIAQPLEHFG